MKLVKLTGSDSKMPVIGLGTARVFINTIFLEIIEFGLKKRFKILQNKNPPGFQKKFQVLLC